MFNVFWRTLPCRQMFSYFKSGSLTHMFQVPIFFFYHLGWWIETWQLLARQSSTSAVVNVVIWVKCVSSSSDGLKSVVKKIGIDNIQVLYMHICMCVNLCSGWEHPIHLQWNMVNCIVFLIWPSHDILFLSSFTFKFFILFKCFFFFLF